LQYQIKALRAIVTPFFVCAAVPSPIDGAVSMARSSPTRPQALSQPVQLEHLPKISGTVRDKLHLPPRPLKQVKLGRAALASLEERR